MYGAAEEATVKRNWGFMMETNDIKKLIADLMEIMKDSKLSEMEVEVEGARVRLRREGFETKQTTMVVPAQTMGMPVAGGQMGAGEGGRGTGEAEKGGKKIVSPMVGDVVEEDTVVCIIEAMKVMNEIKAEMKGKVVEALVNNGEAVEYGQVLFIIEPTA